MQIPTLFTENFPGLTHSRLIGAATFILLAASLFHFARKKMDYIGSFRAATVR